MSTNATLSIPLPRVLANVFFPYAGLVVVVSILFGGGARQGLWSDAVAELTALPLLAWALFRLAPGRSARWGVILFGAILALPLLQLIPLPPALWTALPDRSKIASAYDAAGIAMPWLPVSLYPAATWRSLLVLIPGAAVFLAMLSLDKWARRRLIALVLLIAFIGVCIGFLQIMGGAGLYFYAITNEGMAVGFFANGNHNAAFLSCGIPFASAWLIGLYSERVKYPVAVSLMAALLAVLVIGVAVVGSRAGLGLGFAAGALCIAMAYRIGVRSDGRVLPIAMVAFLIAVLIAVQFSLSGWERRGVQERDLADDVRWPVATVTLQAALKYLPFGTGFGTFISIYEMSAPRTHMLERYVNHAHDDWLELALEGGILALACLIGFFAWFGMTSFRAWRRHADILSDRNFACAGSIAIVLLMLHSIVDYPLRTIAVMTVFALSCGFLVAPANAKSSGTQPSAADLSAESSRL